MPLPVNVSLICHRLLVDSIGIDW